MPTPLGHALGGFIVGWLVAGGRLQKEMPSLPTGRDEASAPPNGQAWRPNLRLRAKRDGATSPKPWRGRASFADRRTSRLARWLPALAFALVGMSADLDLLVGRHSQFTHSIGAAAAVFALAFVLLRRHRHALILALAVAAAYTSHPLLDWLGEDATPPYGITAFWPFSAEYHSSHVDLFRGIARYYWRPGALQQNALAIAWEIIILAPVALGAWWLRRPPRPSQNLPPETGGGPQRLQSSRANDH